MSTRMDDRRSVALPGRGTVGENTGPAAEFYDDIALELRRVSAHAALDLAMAISDVLTQRLYGGDPKAWRRRAGGLSLRRLAARPDVPFSAASLYRALATHELVLELGGLEACQGLCAAHFHKVMSLPAERRIQLLHRARSEGWTPRQLAGSVEVVREPGARRVGRPRNPPVLRELRRLHKLCSKADGPFSAKQLAGDLSQRQLVELVELLDATMARLRTLGEIVRR